MVNSGKRQIALAGYGPQTNGGPPMFYYFPPGMTTAKSETNASAAQRWARQVTTTGHINMPMVGTTPLGSFDLLRSCFGFAAVKIGAPQVASFAPGACNYAQPIPGQCTITTPEIILDHKTILKDNVDSSVAQSTFNVNCVRSFTAKFSLGGGKKVLSIGGGTSTIKINDKPLLSNIVLADGDNSMKISSTLSKVEPGAWQESTVLTMDFF